MPTVSSYAIDIKTYYPGDIVEIPDNLFHSRCMEKIEEPKPQPKIIEPSKEEQEVINSVVEEEESSEARSGLKHDELS